MKTIYLKSGTIQHVFNDLKDNFKGTLTHNNGEYTLALASDRARGSIKGITFPDGITYMQFDVIFRDDVRISIEPFITSPIFFAYCNKGRIQHSFGVQGDRKTIKKQQTGILKSNSSVNSILHFETNKPVAFNVIQIGTSDHTVAEHNELLIKKLKKTFFKTKKDYLDVSSQDPTIAHKIEELNTLPHKGVARNIVVSRILENILEREIEQHTDGLLVLADRISSFTLKQIEEINKASDFVINLSLELFTTDFLIEKARLFTNKLQRDFKLISNRSMHGFLVFIRIEREGI